MSPSPTTPAQSASWTRPPFSEWQRSGASFEIVSLDVTAGDDVAFAWALLCCGSPDDLRNDPDNRLRLTHEHHSFPDKT